MDIHKRFRDFRDWCPQPSNRLPSKLKRYSVPIAAVLTATLILSVSFFVFSSSLISNPSLPIMPLGHSSLPIVPIVNAPSSTTGVISWYNCVVILPDGTLSDTTGPVQAVGDSYTFAGNTLTGCTTAPIQRDGNTYTLTGNIINYTLLPLRDNIVINGANFTFQAENPVYYGVGIYLSGRTNVTVKNVELTRFSVGIQVVDSSNCVIADNTLGNPNNWYLDANGNGITLTDSSNNIVTGNIIQGGGISIFSSYDNTFRANLLYNCNFVIDSGGGSFGELKYFMNSVDTSNHVDGLPVYYLVNQTGLVITPVTFPQIGYWPW